MFHEFFTAEIIIGLVGIAFTGGVAAYIYKIQDKAQKKVNKIIRQQSKIIKSSQLRRNNRIKWMSDHLVGILGSLRKNYTDLIGRVEEYQEDNSEVNLRKFASLSQVSVTMTLQNLIDIAERDIDAARDYINNAWLAVKFQDTLPFLGWGVIVQKEQIPYMDSLQLSEYKDNLRKQIGDIDYYIQTIKDEIEDEGSSSS